VLIICYCVGKRGNNNTEEKGKRGGSRIKEIGGAKKVRG